MLSLTTISEYNSIKCFSNNILCWVSITNLKCQVLISYFVLLIHDINNLLLIHIRTHAVYRVLDIIPDFLYLPYTQLGKVVPAVNHHITLQVYDILVKDFLPYLFSWFRK